MSDLAVLLAEADPAHAHILAAALGAAGIRVITATSDEQLLELARLADARAWVVGDRAGSVDGTDLVRVLRARDADTPCIHITARGSAGLDAGLEAGADEVVLKVPGVETLLPGVVLQALARGRSRAQRTTSRTRMPAVAVGARTGSHIPRGLAWLSSLSHELRTPLTTVLGFSGVLLERASGPLTGEQERQVQLIQGAAQNLLELVNDMLDLARLEAGRAEVTRVPLELRALLEDLREVVVRLGTSTGLAADVEGNPVEVHTDPARLRQLLWNVLQYLVRGGHGTRVVLRVEEHGEDARVVMSTDGPGLSADDLRDIFDPFPDVNARRARRAGERGLGLALAADLARALGGRLVAATPPQGGLAFTLHLPGRTGSHPPAPPS